MKIIKINPKKPDKKIIKEAIKIIKKGGTVIVPTDTVYGLTANALDKKAVKRLFLIKERPTDKPFSVFVKDLKMAKKISCIDNKAEKNLRKLWPGQITFILSSRNFNKLKFRQPFTFRAKELDQIDIEPRRPSSFSKKGCPKGDSARAKRVPIWEKKKDPDFLTAGKKTIGLRIPDCLIIKNLFDFLNFPLIGTSANISGKPASGEMKKVIKQFQNKKNKPDLILDAGNLPESKPSTIVDLTLPFPKILRKGKISF